MTTPNIPETTPDAETGIKLRILVDTCVWLDVAKDYRQRATIAALQQMVESDAVELILPRQVVEEFARNKDRIVGEARRSLSSTIRRVKDALTALGGEDRKATLAQLDDADHQITTLGSAVNDSIGKVEALFASAKIIETSDTAKLLAAERALKKQAPFHKTKNSMGDAILVELYAEALAGRQDSEALAFVTHNKQDFSDMGVDERRPHPDLAGLFDCTRSIYALNLAELLNDFAPEWMEDLKFDYEWQQEPRRLSEILEAEHLLFRQIWYNRHWNTRIAIEEGREKVVAEKDYSRSPYKPGEILDSVWARALEAAKRTEDEVGLDNLGPWSDFEWGMLNGKLSALRWVLGDEWDMLDT
ncbi:MULTISPECIES: PIN domain-containing protein [unclassified Sphingobium]|uniref:PIN domain-containing protein n=1 Tax=unclassified Sphingobium TaxID=2611147 RepID=UPI0035A6F5A5